MPVPMMTDAEWEEVEPLLRSDIERVKSYRGEHPGVGVEQALSDLRHDACERYYEMTGYRESNPNALWHHHLSHYGPECEGCGYLLRTPEAGHCAHCGLELEGGDDLVVEERMEPLNRVFRAQFVDIILVGFLLLIIEIVFIALLPFESPETGGWLILIPLMTVVFLLLLSMTRLELVVEDDVFLVRVKLLGMVIYRYEQMGKSWHAIAKPSRSEENFTGYRVEVSDLNGNRNVAIGGMLCWIYGVDCL